MIIPFQEHTAHLNATSPVKDQASTASCWQYKLKPAIPYLLILLAGTALYVPLTSGTLYNQDSVGFALSIHDFDLRMHQPHPPGYPLYVLALRVIQFLTGASDNSSMILLSIAATITSAFVFYRLIRSWVKPLDALLVSIILLTSPVVWFNADLALSYPLGMLGSLAVALTSLQLLEGSVSARYFVPVVWGLAAGFRQELGVMMAPLVIYSARNELLRSKRYKVIFLILATIAVSIWLIPLIWISGGPLYYFGKLRAQASAVSPISFVLDGDFSESFELIVKNVLVGTLFVFIGSLGMLPVQATRGFQVWFRSGGRQYSSFLAVWAVPGIVLHTLTTVGQSGYVLPYLPALILLLLPQSRGESVIQTQTVSFSSLRGHLLVGGIVFQIGFFLLVPQQEGRLSGHWAIDTLFRSVGLEATRSRVEKYDVTVRNLVDEIKSNYVRDKSLLMVPVGDERPRNIPIRAMFAHGRYYLPKWEQRVLYTTSGNMIAEVNENTFNVVNTNIIYIPRHVRWLVWFCDVDTQPYDFDDSWTRYSVAGRDGVDIVVADVGRNIGQNRHWGPFEFRPEGFAGSDLRDRIGNEKARGRP